MWSPRAAGRCKGWTRSCCRACGLVARSLDHVSMYLRVPCIGGDSQHVIWCRSTLAVNSCAAYHHGVLLWSGRSRVWNDSNFHCYVGLNVFGEGTIVGHGLVWCCSAVGSVLCYHAWLFQGLLNMPPFVSWDYNLLRSAEAGLFVDLSIYCMPSGLLFCCHGTNVSWSSKLHTPVWFALQAHTLLYLAEKIISGL